MSFAPNPPIMENVFRRRLGLNVSGSVVNRNSNNNILGGTMRCLFGAPDPKQAKDVVREVELKNALNFGKRYNFDIINGEPFPSSKRRKVSHPNDSDEENQHVNDTHAENVENDNKGYIWTETYNQEQMAMCNTKHAVNTNIVGPNRYSGVSLLCAISVHSNQAFSPNSSSVSSSLPDTSNQTEKESPKISPSSQSDISSSSTVIIPGPLYLVSSNETNNDVINNNKSHSNNPITTENGTEKKLNLINSSSYDTHQTNQQSSLAKKSTLSSAHHIVKKYTNHAVKKSRQSVITGNLQI